MALMMRAWSNKSKGEQNSFFFAVDERTRATRKGAWCDGVHHWARGCAWVLSHPSQIQSRQRGRAEFSHLLPRVNFSSLSSPRFPSSSKRISLGEGSRRSPLQQAEQISSAAFTDGNVRNSKQAGSHLTNHIGDKPRGRTHTTFLRKVQLQQGKRKVLFPDVKRRNHVRLRATTFFIQLVPAAKQSLASTCIY